MTTGTLTDDFSTTTKRNARDEERAQGFYNRLRSRIHSYVEGKGRAVERVADFLLLVPDVFMLLWRLLNDSRVAGKDKVLLGSGLAYFFLPIDIVPEAIVGPIGYLDDLVFGVYILNRMLVDTDVEILRQHWPGEDDVLDMIRKVLQSADQLVATDVIAKLRKK